MQVYHFRPGMGQLFEIIRAGTRADGWGVMVTHLGDGKSLSSNVEKTLYFNVNLK